MTTSVLYTGRMLTRLWATIVSDFEIVICRFLEQPSWEFRHFCVIAKEMKLPLIMNIAVSRGKDKDEEYEVIARLLLDTAKRFWLRTKDQIENNHSLYLKRRLGGFFLTYLMYLKQPNPGQTKITADVADMALMTEFIDDVTNKNNISNTRNAQAILFGFNYLVVNDAFLLCADSTECGIEGWRRMLLTNLNSETTQMIFKMRDLQDLLAHGDQGRALSKPLAQYTVIKGKVRDNLKMSVSETAFDLLMNWKKDKIPIFFTTKSLDKVPDVVKTVSDLTNIPVLTLNSLTATETCHRKILAETRRRIMRQRKKLRDETEATSTKPYVREGGIFGRKHERDEEKETHERRERGVCSGNLWTYINGLTFDKPMGNFNPDAKKTEKEPTPEAADGEKNILVDDATAETPKPSTSKKTLVKTPKRRKTRESPCTSRESSPDLDFFEEEDLVPVPAVKKTVSFYEGSDRKLPRNMKVSVPQKRTPNLLAKPRKSSMAKPKIVTPKKRRVSSASTVVVSPTVNEIVVVSNTEEVSIPIAAEKTAKKTSVTRLKSVAKVTENKKAATKSVTPTKKRVRIKITTPKKEEQVVESEQQDEQNSINAENEDISEQQNSTKSRKPRRKFSVGIAKKKATPKKKSASTSKESEISLSVEVDQSAPVLTEKVAVPRKKRMTLGTGNEVAALIPAAKVAVSRRKSTSSWKSVANANNIENKKKKAASKSVTPTKKRVRIKITTPKKEEQVVGAESKQQELNATTMPEDISEQQNSTKSRKPRRKTTESSVGIAKIKATPKKKSASTSKESEISVKVDQSAPVPEKVAAPRKRKTLGTGIVVAAKPKESESKVGHSSSVPEKVAVTRKRKTLGTGNAAKSESKVGQSSSVPEKVAVTRKRKALSTGNVEAAKPKESASTSKEADSVVEVVGQSQPLTYSLRSNLKRIKNEMTEMGKS